MNVKMLIAAACCTVTAILSAAEDVSIENARCRLVLSADGYAKSLLVKATGEEMLEAGARVPFSTITQNRAYDNEFKLMYAAKPWTLPSVRIERTGDELRIRYRDEFFVVVVKLDISDSYIGMRLDRFDYDMEATGYKRRTEIDSFALAQLPVKRRGHFGRTLNVVWDEGAGFAALMAARPETRIDAFDRESGGLLLFAGGEKSVGFGSVYAVLAVADSKEPFLDCVDAFERDYGLPRGVKSRRGPLASASYLANARITPENVDEYIGIAKAAGIRAFQIVGGGMWRTNGHFPPKKEFKNGPDDCRKVADALRAAGIVPGLHFFCTKVSRDDEYLAGGKPDSRMNTVCEVILAREASASDTTLYVQSAPVLLRREPDRGLVQFGDELVMYGGFTETPPYMLTNCVRGLWGSCAAAHSVNAIGRHLDVDDWVKFVRCGDSGIIDEIADRIAAWINAAGLRFAYMDGAEDVPEPFWYHVPRVQWNLWKRIKTDMVWSETALKSHFGWHMHTRGNAFDTFASELQRKAMKKYILRTARQDADDFSPVDFGWLRLQRPERPDPARKKRMNGQYAQSAFWNGTIGLQPDTVEYVACKAAAWNSPVGFSISLDAYRKHPRTADVLAAFKRWEDAKLDRRFDAVQLEAFKDGDREWFLWPFTPAERPEPVEWRQITDDSERPIRAFSYSRGGKAGIVYWNVEDCDTPEITLPGIAATCRRDLGRRFIEADVQESELVAAFRKRVDFWGQTPQKP